MNKYFCMCIDFIHNKYQNIYKVCGLQFMQNFGTQYKTITFRLVYFQLLLYMGKFLSLPVPFSLSLSLSFYLYSSFADIKLNFDYNLFLNLIYFKRFIFHFHRLPLCMLFLVVFSSKFSLHKSNGLL